MLDKCATQQPVRQQRINQGREVRYRVFSIETVATNALLTIARNFPTVLVQFWQYRSIISNDYRTARVSDGFALRRLPFKRLHQPAHIRFHFDLLHLERHDFHWLFANRRQMLAFHVRAMLIVSSTGSKLEQSTERGEYRYAGEQCRAGYRYDRPMLPTAEVDNPSEGSDRNEGKYCKYRKSHSKRP